MQNVEGLRVIGEPIVGSTGIRSFIASVHQIEIGRNVIIEQRSFSGFTQLKKISISSGTVITGQEIFKGTCPINGLVIPSQSNVGNGLASGCPGLELLSLPEGLGCEVGYFFEYCSRLKRVCMPDTVLSGGFNTFTNSPMIEAIHFSRSLTTIKESAVRGCASLEKAFLPEGLVEIQQYAFYECYSLEEIHLPSTIEKIGTSAFSKTGLKLLIINARTPPVIAANTFQKIPGDARIVVPHGCLAAYQGALNWSELSNQIEEMDE